MADLPTLSVKQPNGPVTGIALVLHGGRARSFDRVPPWAFALARMVPFARSLAQAGAGDGLVVARLRNQVRGWNGRKQSPVHDARWALEQLTSRFTLADGSPAPIALIGHSMGGRTSIHVADHPDVVSVVALAPWIESYDPIEPMTGRSLLVVHGTGDQVTSPTAAAEFTERARAVTRRSTYVAVDGEKHAMLRRASLWHDLATAYTLGALWNRSPNGTGDQVSANVVREALSGKPTLTV